MPRSLSLATAATLRPSHRTSRLKGGEALVRVLALSAGTSHQRFRVAGQLSMEHRPHLTHRNTLTVRAVGC